MAAKSISDKEHFPTTRTLVKLRRDEVVEMLQARDVGGNVKNARRVAADGRVRAAGRKVKWAIDWGESQLREHIPVLVHRIR